MSEMIQQTAKNPSPSGDDEKALRHGREVHIGYKVGQYVQPPPFFFTADKWPAPFVDMYRGNSCFLIAGGPSFAKVDKNKLSEPGILTMGLNNSPKSFRPNLWTSVDDPASFLLSIWLDPTIQKFVPISHIDKYLFDSMQWRMTETRVSDCPNVWYYKRNERFKADQYLWEDTFNWGNTANMGGGRSVLLAAIRILFMLGIRKIFLLGVDLNMDSANKYHFDQDRSPSSIRGNNSTYKLLQERFTQLRPLFEQVGLQVYNCNPESKLTAFDFLSFDEAIQMARHPRFPADVTTEPTSGMYDRKEQEKMGKTLFVDKDKKDIADANKPVKGCQNCTRDQVEHIKTQVNQARTALHTAKDVTAEYTKLKTNNDPRFTEEHLQKLVNDENEKRRLFRKLVAMRNEMIGI